MSKLFFLLSFCCLAAAGLQAQPRQFTLSGSMVVETGERFPYKIVFTESGGAIKGYSYTFSEPQQTKAAIKGTVDRLTHSLRFKETDIISSQGVRTKAFLCLVHARLEYVHSALGGQLKGAITSADAEKALCTPGSIVFNNDEELQQLFASQEHFDTVISMKARVKEKAPPAAIAAPAPAAEVAATEKLTEGNDKSYDWHSDSVILNIWDGGNIDGDRVTVQFDGATVLAQHYLTRQKKRVPIALPATGMHTLAVIADNEGSDPPNTATLTLADGDRQYSIVAYNLKGHKALIRINKVK